MSNAISNPRKAANFLIEIDGLNQFSAQEVSGIKIGVETVEHGGTNVKVKTAGQATFGDITIKKLRALPNSDKWAWDWVKLVQNTQTGTGGIPSNYKKSVVIREVDGAGATVNTYVCLGCFPKELTVSTMSRTSSDNLMETVVLCVDEIIIT